MSSALDSMAVRALVVRYPGEMPWVAACMDDRNSEILDQESWDDWKRGALERCLADWEEYEIREVVLRVPMWDLIALFDQKIDVSVDAS